MTLVAIFRPGVSFRAETSVKITDLVTLVAIFQTGIGKETPCVTRYPQIYKTTLSVQNRDVQRKRNLINTQVGVQAGAITESCFTNTTNQRLNDIGISTLIVSVKGGFIMVVLREAVCAGVDYKASADVIVIHDININ